MADGEKSGTNVIILKYTMAARLFSRTTKRLTLEPPIYRLELVSKYEILDTLAQLQSKPETRRMALLTLNNLCIPMENKRRFMEHSELLQALYTNIEEMSPDTYLACLCLRNLSCLEDASYERFLSFRKADSGKDLLTILETLTMTFAPHLLARTATRIFLQSAEGHALKWSCGILQQLSKTHAPDVARHEKCILVLLELLQHLSLHLPLHHWTMNDSLGDSCLSVIFNLALADTPLLRRLSTERYLTHLVAKGGIHATRASWIQCWLLEVGADSKPTTAGRRSVLNRMRQEDV